MTQSRAQFSKKNKQNVAKRKKKKNQAKSNKKTRNQAKKFENWVFWQTGKQSVAKMDIAKKGSLEAKNMVANESLTKGT